MANIATCPHCAKQLGLPAAVATTDRMECPECQNVFALSEAVQIALPVARMLEPTERQIDLPPAVVEDSAISTADSTAPPLQSWEQRLKKALASDSSADLAAADDDQANDDEAGASRTPNPARKFELDLDLPKSTETKSKPLNLGYPKSILETPAETPSEPAVEPTLPPQKTLADFAAAADIPALDLEPPAEFSLPSNLQESMAADPVSETVEGAEDSVPTVVGRQVARSGFPKLAAFAVGPVMGGVLGLYGLLWLQGTKADYLGLARVLPESLLPAAYGEPNSDSLLAETSDESLADQSNASLAAARSLMTKSSEPPTVMKHDEAVIPASTAKPVAPAAAQTGITASEFGALVDEASAALPDILAGDLTVPVTVRRKGQAYMTFCRLAEHFQFANQLGLAPAVQAKVRQAGQLFQQVGADAAARSDLAHIASRWWEYEQRPAAGIFLLGRIQRTQAAGAGAICWVLVGDASQTEAIPVFFKQPRFQTGDEIGVVGRVVSSPSDMPAGWTAPQLVRAAYGYRLQ